MKLALLSLVVALGLCSCSRSVEEDSTAGGPAVKVLKKSLPVDEQKREEFLWHCFAREEKKFDSYTTDNWRSNFRAFSEALIKQCDEQKLDSASLRSVLDLVLKDSQDKIAYLPIGAYQMTLAGKPVWVVTVKWESPTPEMGTLPLGHIRAFAFEQKSLTRVAFITCN